MVPLAPHSRIGRRPYLSDIFPQKKLRNKHDRTLIAAVSLPSGISFDHGGTIGFMRARTHLLMNCATKKHEEIAPA